MNGVRTRFAALAAFVVALVALWSRPALADNPPVAAEHVVLHTVAGDLVLALYPTVAPKTVEQILKLVRAGVYDTTAFVRVEPNFVVQLSAHWDRTLPLSETQRTVIHKIPAELVDAVKHTRGALSMAREDADVNSAETSFSILLNAAPHLDGKYTVFGRLESGWPVIDEIIRVPRGPLMRPVVRLEVTRAEVVLAKDLPSLHLAPAQTVPVSSDLLPQQEPAPRTTPAAATAGTGTGMQTGAGDRIEIACGVGLICLVGLVSFYLQGKVPSTVHGSLNLVTVVVGAFTLLLVLVPQGRKSPLLGSLLFFGLIGLFKVLGRFEQPAEK